MQFIYNLIFFQWYSYLLRWRNTAWNITEFVIQLKEIGVASSEAKSKNAKTNSIIDCFYDAMGNLIAFGDFFFVLK